MSTVRDFPLFPLGIVALPSELIPLHIFEERYKTMIGRCRAESSEFGIVWMADDGLRPIGCACEIAEVLEEMPDGRINLIARGTRAFRIEARQDELPYPAGVIEFLPDRDEQVDSEAAATAHDAYAELVRQATDRTPDPAEIGAMTAYEMAATVDYPPSVRDLMAAADDLRGMIQELSERPASEARNEAIRQANDALLATQSAAGLAYDVSLAGDEPPDALHHNAAGAGERLADAAPTTGH